MTLAMGNEQFFVQIRAQRIIFLIPELRSPISIPPLLLPSELNSKIVKRMGRKKERKRREKGAILIRLPSSPLHRPFVSHRTCHPPAPPLSADGKILFSNVGKNLLHGGDNRVRQRGSLKRVAFLPGFLVIQK